jgi:hypothetical protein
VTHGEPISPQLEGLRREFQAARHNAEDLLGELTDDGFRTRPRPGSWSVGECLDHLNAVARTYLPALERAVEEGRRDGHFGTGPFGYGVGGSIFIWLMEPPPRLRLPAPGTFRPADLGPLPAVREDFHRCHDRYGDVLDGAEGLDLSRIRVSSPVSGLLRFNLAAALAFLAAHERRHLWQARRVRRSLEISS